MTIYFSTDEGPYLDGRPAPAGERRVFKFTETEHTPYTSRKDDATARVQIEHAPDGTKGGWLNVRTEVITTDRNGRQSSRVHSVSIRGEARHALLAYLRETEGE